jgi:ribonuclease HI
LIGGSGEGHISKREDITGWAKSWSQNNWFKASTVKVPEKVRMLVELIFEILDNKNSFELHKLNGAMNDIGYRTAKKLLS